MKRFLLVVLPAIGIAGCASTPEVESPSKTPKRLVVGWIKKDWRLCEADDSCSRPTPKTVALPAPAPVFVYPDVVQHQPAVQETKPAIPSKPAIVHFKLALATPTQEGALELENVIQSIAVDAALRIEGYTDDLGSQSLNNRLARQRAEYVMSWLKARGVKNPMEVEAKGKCCYIAPNNTDVGRAANRRAEIHFVNNRKEIKG
ncbi:OmpA family protein [Sulfuricystis multivorans]|uniref:OmpA family protein n=1 Tax=Sulfuricystis multivorans TaxID=2211108 RepID=UPI000F81FCC6|nr:OmpA family protein [Sulfuricystis multivorans]